MGKACFDLESLMSTVHTVFTNQRFVIAVIGFPSVSENLCTVSRPLFVPDRLENFRGTVFSHSS
jgi:hypothetical protein